MKRVKLAGQELAAQVLVAVACGGLAMAVHACLGALR